MMGGLGRLLLCVVALWPVAVSADDYVFVFHSGSTATVCRADDLDFIAAPEVGPGAVAAIGVPDPDQITSLLKIYVLRTDSVVVLNPGFPFAVRKTFFLQTAINHGERSAFLTPNGRQLIVAAGDFLHVFDAVDPAEPGFRSLDMGGHITGVTATSDSDRAYVITEGSMEVRTVALMTDLPQVLAGPLDLPEIPKAIGSAPNASGIYAASDTSVFEIDPLAFEITATIPTELEGPKTLDFDPEPPVASAFVVAGTRVGFVDLLSAEPGRVFSAGVEITEVIAPGDGSVYGMFGEAGAVVRANIATGAIATVQDPDTAAAFPLPAVDLEVGPGGKSVVIAFGDTGLLVRMDVSGVVKEAEVIPPSPPTGIAVITELAPFVGRIETYGGDRQFAAPGARLRKPLAVRLTGLDGKNVAGRGITFSSDEFGAVLLPTMAETNLLGVAYTLVTVPGLDPFEVEARFSPGAAPAVFDVNVGGEGLSGLKKLGGDYQAVEGGEPLSLPLIVEATIDREPVGGLGLMVLPSFGVTCPAAVETDFMGIAEINCTAPEVAIDQFVAVNVEDTIGRSLDDPFRIKVVPEEGDLPNRFFITSTQPIAGVGGETIPGAVMGRVLTAEGFFGTDTGVSITSPDDIFIDTPLAISNETGEVSTGVTLGCSLGPGAITATLLAPSGVTRMIPFMTMTGAPATLTKTRGDLQTGMAGAVLNGPGQGLFAELKDACGNPISSEPIVWEVSPPDGATFANVFPRTNDAGEVFAFVRLGNQPGPVALTATTGGLSTTFNLTIGAPATLMREAGGDGQLISIGEAATFPLVVELLGDSADPVEGLAVDFTITEGSGSLTSNQATSNTLGRASVGVIAGALLGPLTVEARAGDLVFVFRLTVVGRTPFVSSVGFVNSGSFLVGFVPGGGGTIFRIGLMEGVDGIVVPDTFPFPLELRGVKVFVNGVQVPIIAIANVNGQEQINIQVPFETPAPADRIEVIICNNGAQDSFFVQTFRTQPGLFEIPFAEGLFVAAIDLDFRVVGPNNPVEPGSIFSLFLTSMGPTTPAVGTNVPGGVPPAVTVETPQVLINGQPVQVLGSFYAPGLITGYQLNIVASDLPLGIYPIQVIAGGVASKESLVFIEP